MKTLSIVLFLVLRIAAYSQGMCENDEGKSDRMACQLELPIGDHIVSLQASPNFKLQLEQWFKLSLRGEKYKVAVRIAVLDSIPFVYNVQCHGCENTIHEWRLRSILHNTSFRIVDDRGSLPIGLFQSSLIFTVTPRD